MGTHTILEMMYVWILNLKKELDQKVSLTMKLSMQRTTLLKEGGFGGVYKGLLSESNAEVVVKRVSKGSKQGKNEYISKVMIISRLRHRNLVQLIGWCHEQGELLLAYKYMPNGSLDTHLFRVEIMLIWPVRYKIALGLTSTCYCTFMKSETNVWSTKI